MNKILLLLVVSLLGFGSITAQKVNTKKDPVGKWLFEAPAAPEGYTSGSIEVTFADKKHAVSFSVTGSENTLPAEKVAVANDSLKFNLYLENEIIVFDIKIVDRSKMIGKAVYSGGEVVVSFFREEKKE